MNLVKYIHMKEDVGRWWKKAKKDLSTAKFLLDGEKYEESAFFSQQAAEKALKALCLKKFGKIRKIHDLVELGRDANLPEELLEKAKELTLAYVYSRYPDIEEAEDMEKAAADFLKYAEKITKWSRKNLS